MYVIICQSHHPESTGTFGPYPKRIQAEEALLVHTDGDHVAPCPNGVRYADHLIRAMVKTYTWHDFLNDIASVIPNAQVGEDSDGQYIVYTGLKADKSGCCVVPFDE